MNRRLKMILTRPNDESFEAFVSFRQNIKLKNRTDLIKDDLAIEWEKFWEFLKIKSNKKNDQIIQVS